RDRLLAGGVLRAGKDQGCGRDETEVGTQEEPRTGYGLMAKQ
ncbi:hypothetical protein STIAU_1924, partial [Stigmatella aurantiaca DW4/3-1]